MKLSNIKRLLTENLPTDVLKWIDEIVIPLNTVISQITDALSSQLTITDNMLGSVKTFTLTSADFPFTFNHGLNAQPKICFIAQINDNSGNPATFTAAPYAQWFLGSAANTITIQTITGLNVTKKYDVTLVVLAN